MTHKTISHGFPHFPLPIRASSFLLCGAVLFFVGCSGSEFESRISGTVKLDGRAIGPGTLTFVPADGKQNPAVGNVQPDGRYVVTTNRSAGLNPGNYKVSVAVRKSTIVDTIREPSKSAGASPFVHPEKFSSITTSGLAFDVNRGNNTIDIEMKSE